MKYVDPPFQLGETLDGTDADSNLINESWLGQIFELPAIDASNTSIRGGKARLTGRQLRAVILRNTAGFALLPKRVVTLEAAAGYDLVEAANGYCDVLAEGRVAIVDEFLPTAGVADDDIFWGIIGGPVNVLVPTAGADFNGDISVGAPLVGATGATSGNSTSGRVSNVTIAGQTAGTVAFSMAHNIVGWALSARTTQESTDGTELLINACINI